MHIDRKSSQRAFWPLRWWRGLALGLLIGASGACVAATTSSTFRVVLNLIDLKDAVQCGTSGDRVVSVTCTDPNTKNTPAPRGQSLYLFRQSEWLGTVDAMMTTGTVTSWRVVRVADRDYLEIVVGW